MRPDSELLQRLALRSWQKSRLLPAGDVVGLRPASAGP